ncbi:MAG: GTPase, partial [Gemmataceae bacterium]
MTSPSAALLTPQGKGAIASIGLRGKGTWDTLRDLFHPISGNLLPELPEVDRYWFGRLGEEMQDEAILAVLSGAPEWAMEIHVHGGREMTRYLLDLLERRGVATKTWEDNQSSGSYQEILSRAATTRTAGMILDQMNGAFEREIQAILEELDSGDIGQSSERMANLIRWIPLCRHLVHPYRIVVAGATNVGKSSLVNCMAGYQRAIVSAEAGTTRDAVATLMNIDGWPVEVIDTAGLRETGELLEAAGIDVTWEELEQADLILWVLDASRPPLHPPRSRENLHLVI